MSSSAAHEVEGRKSTTTLSMQSLSSASLTSRSVIRQNTLPSFLRFTPGSPRDALATNSLQIYDRSEPETAPSSRRGRLPSREESFCFNKASRRDISPIPVTRSPRSLDRSSFSDFDLGLNDRNREDEAVLKCSTIQLTNYDISTFNPSRDFTANVIDAYYSILRKRHRKDLLKDPVGPKVLLANNKLASAVFDQQATEAVCSRRDIFNFE